MSQMGFHIVRVALLGDSSLETSVELTSGLNVISGPSDTGKTFILQCIDYALGSKSRPAEIPEASTYHTVVLEIEQVSDQSRHTISRSLKGGDVLVCGPSGKEQKLHWKHDGKREDNLSQYLLKLCGLGGGKRVRKNKRGETRSLSFRDLSHLIIVSEKEIIQDHSPAMSGQYISSTVEKSVMRLLLSGSDDEAVIAVEATKISKAKIDAKSEVVEQIATGLREQVDPDLEEAGLAQLTEQLDRLDTSYEEVNQRFTGANESIAEIESRRKSAWTRIRRIESRIEVLRGLSERFELLEAQYSSDLERLEAVSEAGFQLEQLGVERCPVCGSDPEHHNSDHQQQDRVKPEAVNAACAAEALRIRSLLGDLSTTRSETKSESNTLVAEQAELQGELADLASTMSSRLRPQAIEMLSELREVQEQRTRIQRGVELLQQIDDLGEFGDTFESGHSTVGKDEFTEIAASDAEQFSREAESRLRAWNYPGLDRVTFSEADWDIVISGRRRTSHGKGVRAVTHAAFTTALLKYSTRRDMPHPGFIVLDSPLVVYREPDQNEESFSLDVKGSFFRDLSKTFADDQVIVIENEEPPADLVQSGSINLIRFTKTASGRVGFIPAIE